MFNITPKYQNIPTETEIIFKAWDLYESQYTASAYIVAKQENGQLGYVSEGIFASTGSNVFTGDQIINSDLYVNGNVFVSSLVSASIIYESGSTKFGNSIDDTHEFTGSVLITGSTTQIGNTIITGSVNITGSLNVNGQPVVLGPLGWARYDDTIYTTSSAFEVTVAAGEQTLPNNAGNTIEEHMHSSISFYNPNTQKIQVENNADVYMCTVVFKAKTPNANGTHIRLQLDSTAGTPYERVGKDLFFGKGNDVWHEYHEVFQYYADSDFLANGNRWKIQSFGNTTYIADVVFFIQRTQNHRTA